MVRGGARFRLVLQATSHGWAVVAQVKTPILYGEENRVSSEKILEECFTNMNEKQTAGVAKCLFRCWFKPQGVGLVYHFEHIPRVDFRFTFAPFTGSNCMICVFHRIHGMVDLPTFTMKINSVI